MTGSVAPPPSGDAFAGLVRRALRLVVGRGFGSALAIPRLILVAQLFGAEAFGRYGLLTAYAAIGVVAVELGLKTAGPRRAAARPEDAPALVARLVTVQGGLAVALAVGVLALGALRPPEVAFVLAFLLGPMVTSAGVVRRGLGDVRLASRLEVALSVARLLPTLAALVLPLQLDDVYLATLLATLCVVPFARLRLAGAGRVPLPPLAREGATLLIAAGASQLFGRVDLLVLSWFGTDLDLARYSAPGLVVQGLTLAAFAVAATAVGWFSALREQRGAPAMLAAAAGRSWLLVAGTAGLSLVAAVVADPVLEVVVGLAPGPAVVVPLLLSAAPAAGSYWMFTAFAAAERGRAYAATVAAVLVGNLLLDLVVVPRALAAGAAWGSLASETALYLAMLRLASNARRTPVAAGGVSV